MEPFYLLKIIYPFAIAFAIGFLIGIERERSHPPGTQAIGVRTFILIALLGAFAAFIKELALTIVLSAFAFSAILLGYFRSSQRRAEHIKIGLTTELSAGVVFCLGYMTSDNPLLVSIIAVAVLFILVEMVDCAAAKIPATISPAIPTGTSLTINSGRIASILNVGSR